MIPSDVDFELIIGVTFGPYTYAFNSTKSRKIGDITSVNPGTDVITLTAHGLVNTNQVKLTTTGVLPAPLAENQIYYIVSATTDTFKLSLTSGGAAIDLLDAGDSGTDTVTKRGIPLDLSGWSFWSWVKSDLDDPDSPVYLDLSPFISDATNGLVQIKVEKSTSFSLDPVEALHSLIGSPPGIPQQRLCFTRGKFSIVKVSTHPA